MNEQDEAMETVVGWAGRRPQRELMVAVLMGARMPKDDKRNTSDKPGWKSSLKCYVEWADAIIKYCKENPPA
jgi:hypothetical protein